MLDSVLAQARARTEALRMTSLVTIRREGPSVTVDGLDVPAWVAVHVGLPFRLVAGTSQSVTVGGVEFEEATARGDMPWDTRDLRDDDLIEVTSGEWVGSVYRIVKAVKGDQRTARRVPVVEAQRPEEWT
jgi:hypothetical protein